MIIDTRTLENDERVYLELRALYEEYGYRQFRMRKFEEYSLYLENKRFMGNENVITFNSPRGKLLALKPDVTLSIVKNANATGVDEEKLYYRESVYRLCDGEFREISQMGLERIGAISLDDTLEILTLARESLKVVNNDYIFAVSDMGFIGGLLSECGLDESLRPEVLGFLKAKNVHELKELCQDADLGVRATEKLLSVAGSTSEFSAALATAYSVAEGELTKRAVDGLATFYQAVKGTEDEDKVKLDFSILNDIDYYNGIIFQGYVADMPKLLLSGGRYDSLLRKFNKEVGAMGFALSLSDISGMRKEND